MCFFSFATALSQCANEMKPCPNGVCDTDCNRNVSDNGVEAIVAIMSVSVVLIIGLVILLVYICLKQGPWWQNEEDTGEPNAVTCNSTAVEIPEYLLRRRFSSLSMTSGPPPYYSLFNFICNENGEILHTVIAPQNLRTQNARLPSSTEQPPDYGVLFGQSPPAYELVIQSEATTRESATTTEPATNVNVRRWNRSLVRTRWFTCENCCSWWLSSLIFGAELMWNTLKSEKWLRSEITHAYELQGKLRMKGNYAILFYGTCQYFSTDASPSCTSRIQGKTF